MTPPRLHIAHTEASLGWGGQEIRILTESQGMIERGHQVSLLTPSDAQIHKAAKTLGIEVVAMPYKRKSLRALCATRRWLQRQKPDVINTHSSIDSWMVGLARLASRRRIPVVRTRHISAPVSSAFSTRWLYLGSADRVVTTGEILRQDLLRRLQGEPDHFVSVPTGIDLARYSPDNTAPKDQIRRQLSIPGKSLVVGIAATLRSWKGHDTLLDAFAMVAEILPNLHLLIVGDGPRRDVIRDWINRSGLSNRIRCTGHRDDVPDMLAAMDIFALPSYANEGVPQAIMQAMAIGLPVISTEVGAIGEAVVDGYTGLMVKPKDAAALADAIDRLAKDEALRTTFGKQGRQRVEERFGRQRMCDHMETLFYEMAAASNPAASR